MKQNTLRTTLTIATFSLCLAARADVVTDWNSAALNAIRGNRTAPPRASRNLAILHASIYDAVNGISRKHEPYLVLSADLDADARESHGKSPAFRPSKHNVPASASKEAAASAAAHKALLSLFPTDAAAFDALHSTILAGIRNGPAKATGVAWGETVATQILLLRANDGESATLTPPPALAPGDWVPTPPAFAGYALPQWAQLTCFSMTHPAQFRPPGPPVLTSANYAAAFNEVKALGAATGSSRTAEQTQIALFWADGGSTETPPGHWNHIAQDVASLRHNSLEENARLFALLNLAMADAAICAWDAKYAFHSWRPITAIRLADMDGNADTALDPVWSPLLATPPFPEYVSGHSTFSAAGATVLAMFYHTDNISFTTGSDFLPGVTRSFASFSAAAEEAMNSRLYGGIHFRFGNEDGLTAGLAVGEWTVTHYLRKNGGHSRK